MLSIGLENPDPKMRDALGKMKMKTEVCYRIFAFCKKKHVASRCLTIVGSPDQDEQNLEQMAQVIEECGPSEVRCGIHAIYPGTRDWDRYSHLLIKKNDWIHADTGHQMIRSKLPDAESVRLDFMRRFYNGPSYRQTRLELILGRQAFETGYNQLESGFLSQYGLIQPENRLQ
jgi:radical SAM superfamily enzyme YgiQ (UPF0313 family)